MINQCKLCKKNMELIDSHIIPKFVFNHLKKTSLTGKLRMTQNPDLRVQDGIKLPFLCKDCETLLNQWEKPFCEQIFKPLHDSESKIESLKYGDWALRFAVSVSWRVLEYWRCERSLEGLSDVQLQATEVALESWRKFLLGRANQVNRFEQHVLPIVGNELPIDVIKSTSAEGISPFLNRYLIRGTQMDVIASEHSAFVYSKLGRVLIFGFIKEPCRSKWKGTKIFGIEGTIKSRGNSIPQYIGKYLNEKAEFSRAKYNSMSLKQDKMVSEIQKKNLNRIAELEIFRAMQLDVELSGKDAFKKVPK